MRVFRRRRHQESAWVLGVRSASARAQVIPLLGAPPLRGQGTTCLSRKTTPGSSPGVQQQASLARTGPLLTLNARSFRGGCSPPALGSLAFMAFCFHLWSRQSPQRSKNLKVIPHPPDINSLMTSCIAFSDYFPFSEAFHLFCEHCPSDSCFN